MLSPAKINLGLEVFHRREKDGYHYLAGIFIPISFGDDIAFSWAEENSITTENLLPPGQRDNFEQVSERGDIKKNLLWKVLAAAEKLLPKSIHIHLIKRIPTGAGLGGGSSNAGMLLKFIRDDSDVDPKKLFKIAVEHGADIPFFLTDHPMLVCGIGDNLQPIKIGSGFGVLSIPYVMISTKMAYQALKRALQTVNPPKSWSVLNTKIRQALMNSEWNKILDLKNDFEEVVFNRYPELETIKKNFYKNGANYASLSGSGSALYALVKSKNEQEELLERMRSDCPDQVFESFHF